MLKKSKIFDSHKICQGFDLKWNSVEELKQEIHNLLVKSNVIKKKSILDKYTNAGNSGFWLGIWMCAIHTCLMMVDNSPLFHTMSLFHIAVGGLLSYLW